MATQSLLCSGDGCIHYASEGGVRMASGPGPAVQLIGIPRRQIFLLATSLPSALRIYFYMPEVPWPALAIDT